MTMTIIVYPKFSISNTNVIKKMKERTNELFQIKISEFNFIRKKLFNRNI